MPRLQDIPTQQVADAVARAVVEAVAAGGDAEAIVARALARAKVELDLAPGSSIAPDDRSPATPITDPGSEATTISGRRAARVSNFAPAPLASGKLAVHTNGTGRPVLTESDVLDAIKSGRSELRVAPGTIVTALARDTAHDGDVRLVEA